MRSCAAHGSPQPPGQPPTRTPAATRQPATADTSGPRHGQKRTAIVLAVPAGRHQLRNGDDRVAQNQCWSMLLAAVFLVGLVLVGQNIPWGWVVGIADELLWIVYAVATRQWAFIVSATVYVAVCARNLRTWRYAEKDHEDDLGR